MWPKIFFAAVIGMLLSHAAQAQSVDKAMRDFGMLGTWAYDCKLPASNSNSHSTIVASPGRVTQTYDYGSGSKNVYVIQHAVIRGDKISTRELFLGNKSMMDVVTLKKDGRIRVWSSQVTGGKVLVTDGFIPGANRETKWLMRCR